MPDARELPIWRCRRCAHVDSAPFSRCPACARADIETRSIAGRGIVQSWTIVRRPPPAFQALGAYAVGIVVLDGGLRVPGRLEVDAGALSVDLPVVLADVVDGAPIFVARGADA